MFVALLMATSIVLAPNSGGIALHASKFQVTGFGSQATNTVSIIGNGDSLAEITATGQVKCFAASRAAIEAYEHTTYGGMYHALCDHLPKVKR